VRAKSLISDVTAFAGQTNKFEDVFEQQNVDTGLVLKARRTGSVNRSTVNNNSFFLPTRVQWSNYRVSRHIRLLFQSGDGR
jgi:hypothetical protein